jgi:iron(III) transport system substrate-binding protein
MRWQSLVAGLSALALAACAPAATGGTSPSVATPAQSQGAPAAPEKSTEGTIVVYTALEEDQLKAYVPIFTQRYPNIKLEIVRDSTGIITSRLLAEKDNPRADVVWGLAATSLLVAAQQNMLEAYAPENLGKVNPRFRDSANPPRWVGIDVWEAAICVNTVEMQKRNLPIPTTWADLAKPEYRGLIVMPNPGSSGTGYLAIAGWMKTMGRDGANRYMDQLHENIAAYTHSGSKPCRQAGTGEFPMGISFGYRGVTQARSGEPIRVVWPTEGSGWDLEANSLIRKATIKPAARTFLDWALTDQMMIEYAKNYPITSIPTGQPVPAGYLPEPLRQLVDLDLNQAARDREAILAEWTRKYDGKSEPR